MVLYMKTNVCTFLVASSRILLRMITRLDTSCRENQNKPFYVQHPPPPTPSAPNHTVYEIMWKYTRSVRKVSDRIFLCEHLMDYNLARLHEPILNLSAHA